MLARTAIRLQLNAARPALALILPKKKTVNRLLFDNDARLPYKKIMPILNNVYQHLDTPEEIRLPSYTGHEDLMDLRSILHDLRSVTNLVNKNLVDLENELVEQAAELGNNDAIAMLAFEALADAKTLKEDYDYANKLVSELTGQKHPLVFKLAGDFAFGKQYHEQAAQYWEQFLTLESDTISASHVYANLGTYYYHYLRPRPDLAKAQTYFEKAVAFGQLDSHIVKAHYFLGQLYSITDPILSRYHLEISASRGLQESLPSLGFLELNVFDNIPQALEWFRLGVEANSDVSCLIGQFDAHVRAGKEVNAINILANLKGLHEKLDKVFARGLENVPEAYRDAAQSNQTLLKTFFATRAATIRRITPR